ncbi:MAG: type II toxin-antitoxin system HicB family antitoxin [Verrucomicrobiae bacterium]|nr:type II toxin-antitoxin system HicB family antitoxin [Verrucomicrobiae bacterium]
MVLSAVITEEEDGGFVAFNPETGTTTQGDSFEEALTNLREATTFFLEEFPIQNTRPAVMTSFEVAHA